MLITPNPYRRAWAEWLPAALPLLEEEKYADALKTFPKPPPGEPLVFRTAPPAAERRIAFVTSGGAYDTKTQTPFAEHSAIGDVTPRFFPIDLPAERIDVAHGHYDASFVRADREVLLPRRALREAGARMTATVISFMGYSLDWPSLIDETIPQLVKRAQADSANCALLVPV